MENDAFSRLAILMEEQTRLLRRMDERQAAADLTAQPIPQVPATSNSTWGALLRSRVAEAIQPKVERWRSGLDALLVFLGLFSSIVTAFLVDSINALQPDEVARTNELLMNLTEIVIQLNTGAALDFPAPVPFAPDPVNVRLNSYWFISLILSLSVAALAVACRSFLNMVLLSGHVKAVDRLIDINRRWKRVEKILGPATEVVPQLLIIPVILFLVGLLDNVFSSVLVLPVLPIPITVACALSLFFITGLVGFLAFALWDAILRPHDSPFPSTLARVTSSILPITQRAESWLRRNVPMPSTYHEVVQATYDDHTLDQAAAALLGVLKSAYVVETESGATLIHLLSPEASRRCNHTAARVVVELSYIFRPSPPGGRFHHDYLLDPLTLAARRSVSFRPLVTLWRSAYIKALAVIIDVFPDKDYPPVMAILGSNYMLPRVGGARNRRYEETRDLLLDIFFDFFAMNSAEAALPPSVVRLFEPRFISPQHVLALTRFLVESDQEERALSLVALLMAAKTPSLVLALAHKRILDESGIIWDLTEALTEGYIVIKSVLAGVDPADANDSLLMADLCSACVLGVKRCVERLQPCLLNSPWALRTLEAALFRFPHAEAAAALTELMAEFSDSVHPGRESHRIPRPPALRDNRSLLPESSRWNDLTDNFVLSAEFDDEDGGPSLADLEKYPQGRTNHRSSSASAATPSVIQQIPQRFSWATGQDDVDAQLRSSSPLQPPFPIYRRNVNPAMGEPSTPRLTYGLADAPAGLSATPAQWDENDSNGGLDEVARRSALRRSSAITANVGTNRSPRSSNHDADGGE
ncbi:hypothetical protein FB45DRAFT_897640 [Roridomyces roridus]|uniref:DUF6535 domain-containing protein n=1 Tax=Roridomyces roridus TaxID=1738132 RepID=A0AAD7CBQ3_9AGAR|nr:hypothetical protein FB45DRAFT_897640 [Roridomyces roridus]